MILQLLELYKIIEEQKPKFEAHCLQSDFFIDVYRSQPTQPETYEYFSLPAIFVDYSMRGNGKNQPRTIALTLHVITDEMPDASNIDEHRSDGLQRFTYLLLLQSILEGTKLGRTTTLKFISEGIVDTPVVNYHVQNYEFDAYLYDLIPNNPDQILGEFETLKIFSSLTNRI